jgi:WS/DGAT/MGAT family acyltransferase
MSGFESLMWELERDPRLSSAFANLTLFDRPPDRATFRRRMEHATARVPRLRQRVVTTRNPLGHPQWVEDPGFDLDHHLRWVDLGGDADDAEVADLAATLTRQPFDRERPLWEFVTIEGLRGGRAAMLQRLHHTITDGEGGIRLSVQFLDLEREPEHQPDAPSAAPPRSERTSDHEVGTSDGEDAGGVDAADRSLRERWSSSATGLGAAVGRLPSDVAALPRRGAELGAVARSTLRQVTVGTHRSPLWRERSLDRQIRTTALSLDDVRDAAHHLGGSVNDLFITGAATAAGRVHATAGLPVEELRVSMPVSTRHDRSAGGNAFSPTQSLVPTGDLPVQERFDRIHQILGRVKAERALNTLEGAANAASLLPSAALVRSGQHLAGSVDFVCSNVRAAPFDLFIAGAFMEANYPLGPLAGTAFNLTTMSYRGWLFLGLVTDPAAVGDPDELLAALDESYDELLSAGGVKKRRRP